jgi:hypothetical protein
VTRRSPRSPILVLAALTLAIGGGVVLGVGLAHALAPRSTLANIVSTFLFPLAFALGWQAWIGLAIALSLPRLFRRFRRLESPDVEPDADRAPAAVLPGAGIFVPIATGMGLAGGLLVGLVSTWPLPAVLVIYTSGGLGYGLVLWWLADAGFFLVPEE